MADAALGSFDLREQLPGVAPNGLAGLDQWAWHRGDAELRQAIGAGSAKMTVETIPGTTPRPNSPASV